MEGDEALYAKKYRAMKKKLRLLVYEREAFLEELKKSQRKLLKISRDKSFLLDRLIAYEQARPTESTTDSESTASSDSEQTSNVKDKKRKIVHPAAMTSGQSATRVVLDPSQAQKKKQPASASKIKATVRHAVRTIPPPTTAAMMHGSLSHEEVERRLEMRRINQPHFMSIGVTSNSLPDDIFSHDNSNPLPNNSADGSDSMNTVKIKVEDDDDANLIIDMAN